METAVKLARIGNFILSLMAVCMMIVMLAYGGYSLWDNYMINSGAFLTSDLLKYKPPENSDAEDNLSLEELMALNPETRGWLTIDGTHIDYPVVQGEDDMKYVNTDIYGEFSLSGAIFLSCINSPDFSDHYNLMYGHHMDNGGMFGDVMEFVETDHFQSHETGTLYLPHKTYGITLFACIQADAYDRIIYTPGAAGLSESGIRAVSGYRCNGGGQDCWNVYLCGCNNQWPHDSFWPSGGEISTKEVQ